MRCLDRHSSHTAQRQRLAPDVIEVGQCLIDTLGSCSRLALLEAAADACSRHPKSAMSTKFALERAPSGARPLLTTLCDGRSLQCSMGGTKRPSQEPLAGTAVGGLGFFSLFLAVLGCGLICAEDGVGGPGQVVKAIMAIRESRESMVSRESRPGETRRAGS